jgi:hypothetical protein
VKLADKIVMRPIDALIPYASNARTHSPDQIAQIAASIREFGFTNPVLVDGEQGIIAGHGRVLATRKLGIDQIPTIELAYLSETQRQAYIIADNKLAENAGWDREMLRLELGELKGLGFDLALTGFGDIELGALFADKTEGLTDPDDAPAVPEHPVAEPGDLWVLGRHRLLCGDSTVATDVERVLGGVAPHLMVTDPPYGVEYDPAWRNQAGRSINETTQGLRPARSSGRRVPAASRGPSSALSRAAYLSLCITPFGSPVVPEVKGRYITWLASPLGSVSSAGPGNSPNSAPSAGPTRQKQRRKSRSVNSAKTSWRSASAP